MSISLVEPEKNIKMMKVKSILLKKKDEFYFHAYVIRLDKGLRTDYDSFDASIAQDMIINSN
jgi:hypothetical protein